MLDRESLPGPHPGTSFVRLTLLNDTAVVRAQAQFATGWRCYLEGAELHPLAGVHEHLVVLRTPPFLGPDVARQFDARSGWLFARVGVNDRGQGATDRPRAVRL